MAGFRSVKEKNKPPANYRRHWFGLGLFLLVCIHSAMMGACRAANIEANGRTLDIVYRPDGSEDHRITNTFQIRIDGDKWECLAIWDEYSERLDYDGTNTYAQDDYSDSNTINSHLPDRLPITTGEIRRGSTCVDGMCSTRLLWVALFARQYFESGPGKPIILSFGHPGLLGADSMTYKAEWLDPDHRVPKNLQFIVSEELWKNELRTKLMDSNEEKPYKYGTIVAEYHVASQTNVDGEALPTAFEMARHGWNKNGQPYLVDKLTGEMGRFKHIGGVLELPPLHMRTLFAFPATRNSFCMSPTRRRRKPGPAPMTPWFWPI